MDTLGDSNTVLGDPDLVTMNMEAGEVRPWRGGEGREPEPPLPPYMGSKLPEGPLPGQDHVSQLL